MKLMETAMPGEWAKFPRIHFTHVLDDVSSLSWSNRIGGSDPGSALNVIRISGAYPVTITVPNTNENMLENHQPHGFHDFTIAHEIGHFVTRNFINGRQSPGGGHEVHKGKYDWTLTMNEGLSHLFGHNVVDSPRHHDRHDAWIYTEYVGNDFRIDSYWSLDTKGGSPTQPIVAEEISGPYMELAVARAMWGIQQKAFSDSFSEAANSWKSLQNAILVNIYPWWRNILEGIDNDRKAIVNNQMAIRGMISQGEPIAPEFGRKIGSVTPSKPVSFEENDLKPATPGEDNSRSWTIDSVRYYHIEKSSSMPTKLHIKCDKNNGFSIDLLKPGSNELLTKITPQNATREPAGEITWGVDLSKYISVPYVIRMRMEQVVNPIATLTFIKE
jgi:hypothetical protein